MSSTKVKSRKFFFGLFKIVFFPANAFFNRIETILLLLSPGPYTAEGLTIFKFISNLLQSDLAIISPAYLYDPYISTGLLYILKTFFLILSA